MDDASKDEKVIDRAAKSVKPVRGKNGGKRPGSGRKKGTPNPATIEQKGTLAELARQHTGKAIEILLKVAEGSESDAARVSAVAQLLDRGYGKPTQAIEHNGSLWLELGERVIRAKENASS